MPALWDSHVHIDTTDRLALMLPEAGSHEIGPEELALDAASYLPFGVTTVVVMDGNEDLLDLREAARRSEPSWLPRLFVATPILDGPTSTNPLHRKVGTPEEARAQVEAASKRGYDLAKVYTFLEREEFLTILEAAQEAEVPVWGHLPIDLSFEEALDARLGNVAHGEEIFRFWDRKDPSFAEHAADALAARGISLTPNLVAYHEIVDEVSNLDAHLRGMRWSLVPPLMRIYSSRPYNGYVEDFGKPEEWARFEPTFLLGQRFMADLVRASAKRGVTLLAGTDSGNPTMFPGQSLHRELQLLVAAGLTPWEALESATLAPERLLAPRKGPRWPRAGFTGDLALLEEDPTADIGNVGTVSGLWIRGALLGTPSLERLAASLSRDYDDREQRYRAWLPLQRKEQEDL